ncbi:NAD(P)/FAD-dependent oxidoreductase [Nocardia sp. NPDC019395]|uniref:flavin-containing monooxygenase n=1 Tax=Nocardia sp. NPDC019395 TaxID=3154686 RepID=UPI0033EA6EBA
MTATDNEQATVARNAATVWLQALDRALAGPDHEALDGLFLDECYVRDMGALTWNLRSESEKERALRLIEAGAEGTHPRNFRLDHSKPAEPSVVGEDPTVVEAFIAFDVDAGSGDGMIYLVEDPQSAVGWRARNLLTRLTGFTDHPNQWPYRDRFDDTHPDVRWSEHRARNQDFEERDPEVLIVGGGQMGVMTAASLNRLGVDNLVVDKNSSVGGNWRNRYASLLLHQPHGMLHFPYMPYPESFPEYIPKDKLADWFQAYVAAMDINFWTSTEFLGGTFDEESKTWDVRVRRGDGTLRTFRPKHVVIATGGTENPRIPDLPGLSDFTGEVVHSSKFSDGRDYTGKNVMVVGVGTSGHDIALDVTKHGGRATILQRSPAIVVDIETANLHYADYNPRIIPTELVDIRFLAGLVYPQLKQNFLDSTKMAEERDADLRAKLREAGMKVWSGAESCGFFYEYFKKGGGYYLEVGASERIISGEIGVIQTEEIESFEQDGYRLRDGSGGKLDTIVLATGYENISLAIADYFGSEVAEKLGPIWGFGTDGEIHNNWKPTAQEGLWIGLGAIPQARWYSSLMATLIQGHLKGLVPESFLAPDHPSRTPREQVVEI